VPAELAGQPPRPNRDESTPVHSPPGPPAAAPLDPVSDRAFRLGILALSALALALGLLRLAHNDIWYDEAVSLHFARQGGLEFFRGLLREDTHGPVYYRLLRFWTLAFGQGAWAARLPSVIFAAAAVAAVAQLGARVFGRASGLAAGLLLALSPLHLFYAQEARFYSFIELLLSLQVLCFISLLGPRPRASRWPWWGFVGTSAACLLTFYLSLLVVLAELICAAVLWKRIEGKRVLGGFAAIAAVFSAWLPALLWQVRHTKGSIDWISDQRTWDFMYQLCLAFTAGKGATWFDSAVAAILVVGATFELVRAARRREPGELALSCWLALPLVAVLVISFKKPLYQPRYFMIVAPAFFLLAAAGVWRARPAWLRWPAAAAILAALAMADGRYYSHFKQAERWNEAVAFVRREAMPTDTLVAVPAHESVVLSHYFPNFRRRGGANYAYQINPAFVRGSRLWLFTHRDADRSLAGQLTPAALLIESRDFGTLKVAALLLRR
jgi:4-amino-4-deoxy-L-arabinose transferase-like glycosyltransferase